MHVTRDLYNGSGGGHELLQGEFEFDLNGWATRLPELPIIICLSLVWVAEDCVGLPHFLEFCIVPTAFVGVGLKGPSFVGLFYFF
jgi:hypothetical protein